MKPESSHVSARVAALLALGFVACGSPSFPEVPESIPHDIEEGGAMHAARLEDPFLCGSDLNDLEKAAPCPDIRPQLDALISCDNAGCHGNFNYTSSTAANRQLWGSEGPSCYTCHGEKWD